MEFLQPADSGRDRADLARRIVGRQDGIIVPRALVLLQRQGMVAALIDDPAGDLRQNEALPAAPGADHMQR